MSSSEFFCGKDVFFLQECDREKYREQLGDAGLAYQAAIDAAIHFLKRTIVDPKAHRAEAHSWLTTALASAGSPAPAKRHSLAELLPRGPIDHAERQDASRTAFAEKLLLLFFEERPDTAATLAASRPSMLRVFFTGHPARAMGWFHHFDYDTNLAKPDFKRGAAALSKYAVAHRSQVWNSLRWLRESHAPATVAAQPLKFQSLDVETTVANFAESVAGFWESGEFLDGVRSGGSAFLRIDAPGLAALMLQWLMDDDVQRREALRSALVEFLKSAPWRQLCARLLPALPEEDVLTLAVNLLGGSIGGAVAASEVGSSSSSSTPVPVPPSSGAILVFSGVEWPSFADLAVASALACSSNPLLRVLREEERTYAEWLRHAATILQLGAGGSGTAFAVHWGARRRFAAQGETLKLRWVLLVHLFIAFSAVHAAAAAHDHRELESLLQRGGLAWELAGGSGSDDSGSEGSVERGASDKKRRRKKRKTEKKDKRRRRRRRRGSFSSDEGEDSFQGRFGGPAMEWRRTGAEGRAGRAQLKSSTIEVVGAVMEDCRRKYVGWLAING